MPNQLVTVDAQTYDLPQVVRDRLATIFPTIEYARNIATAQAGQYVNLNSSNTADNDKVVKRDSTGLFEVKDATSAKHPVSLSQLDSRVPNGGYPLATQLQNGLMSSTDKVKVDRQILRKPFPVGTALKDLEAGFVYTKSPEDGYVNAEITSFRDAKLGFELYVEQSGTSKTYLLQMKGTGHTASTSTDAGGLVLPWDATGGYYNATASLDGLMSKADKAKLDGATDAGTANTLSIRDASGNLNASGFFVPSGSAQSTYAYSMTRKDYVDAQVATRALTAHNHSGANITSGTISPLRIANATASLDGLMVKTDKAKLDSATATNSNNTLVMRDTTGHVNTSEPTSATHATNKTYVDDLIALQALKVHVHDGADITTGLIDQARIANATSTLNGLMSSADKKILDDATDNSTVNTLMKRDASGNVRVRNVLSDVAQANLANALTRKDYVDGLIAQQVPLGGDLLTTDLNTMFTPGDYYVASSANGSLSRNYPFDNFVGTVSVRRFGSSLWYFQIVTQWNTNKVYIRSTNNGATGWTEWTAQATADYVDQQIATRALASHNHDGANITTGTISPLRIANATASLDGLLPKADKAKLDGATANNSNSTLVMRDPTGHLNTATPTSTTHATNKTYVDDLIAQKAPLAHVHDGADITTGLINQARIANATASLNGLMSSADKAKLDGATAGATANVLSIRDSNGNLNASGFFASSGASQPNFAHSMTRKDYVDGLIAQQVSLGGDLLATDLNTLLTPGDYYVGIKANGSLANNYPIADFVGTVSVRRFGSSSWFIQVVTTWDTRTSYIRSTNAGTTGWIAWRAQASHDYVLEQVALRAPLSHNHSGADITSGTINPLRIANATASLDGLLAKADKAKLDGATATNSNNTLVMRDTTGHLNTATPTSSTHATNKTYVDDFSSNASNLTTGTVDPLRIANASSTIDGLMAKLDKVKLDGATPNATANTLVMNDASGRFSVSTPTATGHASNKGYVDAQITAVGNASAKTVHTHSATDITSGVLAYERIPNLYSDSSKTWLSILTDTGGMRIATQGTFYTVSADETGALRTDFAIRADGTPYTRGLVPTYANDLTRKDYVDGKTWSGSDITSGTISPSRIANATASLDGLMSKGDKAKLDTATSGYGTASLVMSDSAGHIRAGIFYSSTAQSVLDNSMTRKDYVDGLVSNVFVGTEIPDNADLNNYTTPGVYHNSANASVATGTNYPSAYAGKLEVVKSGGGTFTYQMWTDYRSDSRIYYRARYNTVWYVWKELVNTNTAKNAVMGNLPNITNAVATGSLDSYTTAGTYIIDSSGSTSDGGLLEVFVATNGDICQRRTIQGSLTYGAYKIRWFSLRSGTVRSWTEWYNG